MKRLAPLLVSSLVGLFASAAVAGPAITISGALLDSGGTPVENNNVQFKVQIRTPGTSDCLMYEETKTLDMTGSDGIFALTLNDGTGTRTDSSGYSLAQVFANTGTFSFSPSACASSTSYSPTATDNRVIAILFNDGVFTGFDALPRVATSYVPASIDAYQVGGFTSSSLLRVADASGNPQPASALSPANFTELLALLNGTSTHYVSSSTSGAALPVLASNTSPSQGDMWFDSGSGHVKYFDGTTTQTVGTSGGSVTSVATGFGLTGGPITSSGTISLATIGSGGTGSKITYDSYGRVTGSASLLPGDLPSLGSGLSGVLPLANGGTGSTTGSISGTGALTFAAGGTNQNVTVTPSGTGFTLLGGQVGIGTANPTGSLTINNVTATRDWGNQAAIEIASSGPGNYPGLYFSNQSTAGWSPIVWTKSTSGNTSSKVGAMIQPIMTTTANTDIQFLTNAANGSANATEKLRITGSGFVGIATNAPNSPLTVNGGATALPSLPTGTLLNIVGSDGFQAREVIDGFGHSASLVLRRAEGTSANPMATMAGVTIGSVGAWGYDGTAYSTAAGSIINFVATENWDPAKQGQGLQFWTTPNGSIARQFSMALDGSGRLGIGTTTPSAPLEIYGSSSGSEIVAQQLHNYSTTAGSAVSLELAPGQDTGTGGRSAQIAAINNGSSQIALAIRTSNGSLPVERMRVDENGNVLVGTTTPNGRLTVAGNIMPSVDAASNLGSSSFRFYNIYSVNPLVNTSDRRLKRDIHALPVGLDLITRLEPVSYRWKEGDDHSEHYGLIAQEAEKALRELAADTGASAKELPALVDHDEQNDRYGLRYTELISPIIKAIQELVARASGTQSKVEALEAENLRKSKELETLKAYLCTKDPNAPFCTIR